MPDDPRIEAFHKLTKVMKEAGWEYKSGTVAPTPPPVWAKIGQWVLCVPAGECAVIEDIIVHDTLGWVAVRVRCWRSNRDDVIEPYTFLKHWKPCEKPVEPRTSWERLLEETLF